MVKTRMLGQYLITFREVFEAALITSIIIAYLSRTNRKSLIPYIWYGVIAATISSIVIGGFIYLVYGILPKSAQALFEGVSALIAVVVLSSVVYWMATKGRVLKAEIEKRVEAATTRSSKQALTLLAFTVVVREGLETVLFLTPFLISEAMSTLIGLLSGTLSALVLTYGIFVIGMKINIRRFFYYTSILLILLAGGLLGYGVHEFIEYTGPEPWGWLGQEAYNLNIPRDSLFHHKGIIGSVFAVMFGYTTSAEWARLIAHLLYLLVALPATIWVYRRK